MAQSNIHLSSKEAGKLATKAEGDKVSHYIDLARNFIIQPVATETMGSWGTSGLQFIKAIGQRIQDNTGEKCSTSDLFQSISMAVQRGNVSSIRGSVPNAKTLNELFYL